MSPNSNSFQSSLCCEVAYGLRQSSRLDGVHAFIDGNQQGKLDGTWKPNNHFTSVPRATLLLFFLWISGFGSFHKNQQLHHPLHTFQLSWVFMFAVLVYLRSNQMRMSDLKGVPNLHLSGVLTVYCIHPMYIHHLSFNFRLCLGFSHILPVPRYGEAMARAVVAEEHRAWLRSTFVPQPAEQLTLVKIGYWIKGIWYLVYLEEEQSQAERSRYHDHSITPNSDTARKCKE